MHKYKGKKYLFPHQGSPSVFLRMVTVEAWAALCTQGPVSQGALGWAGLVQAPWQHLHSQGWVLGIHSTSNGPASVGLLCPPCPPQCKVWNKLSFLTLFCCSSTSEELTHGESKGRTWTISSSCSANAFCRERLPHTRRTLALWGVGVLSPFYKNRWQIIPGATAKWQNRDCPQMACL